MSQMQGQEGTGVQGAGGTQAGQAPAGQQGGQAPPTGEQAGQGTGQSGTQQGWDGQPFDPERARRTIESLREEKRQKDERLAELERKVQEHERSQMTETQRIQAELADERAKREAAEKALEQRSAQESVAEVAKALNFHGPDVAYKLIDLAAIERDKDGKPKRDSVEKLLKAELETQPWLAKPAGNADAGAGRTSRTGSGGSGPTTDMNSLIRRGAGRPA